MSTLMIILKASILLDDFAAKSCVAKASAVTCFMKAHLLVYQMGMHELQRLLEEVAQEALEYMTMVRKLIVSPHCRRHWIINMDQMPVYFSMCPKKTLADKGLKTVHICTSTSDTKQATVSVTVCVDGTILPSMVVCEGQPNGCIAKNEFAT